MTTITYANLVDLESLEPANVLDTGIRRAELESLLGVGEPAHLRLDVQVEGEADPRQLELELTEADVRALLAGNPDDEVPLAVDGNGLASLLDEPEVEAHGLRTGLAIAAAAAAAAVAAPTALGMTEQSTTAAAKEQVVSSAVTSQVVREIVRPGVVRNATSSSTARVSAFSPAKLRILRAQAHRR
jgi:hypothetical protein